MHWYPLRTNLNVITRVQLPKIVHKISIILPNQRPFDVIDDVSDGNTIDNVCEDVVGEMCVVVVVVVVNGGVGDENSMVASDDCDVP